MFILLTFFFLLNFFNIIYLMYKFYVQYKNNKNKIKWNNFYNLLYLNNLKKYLFDEYKKNKFKKCIEKIYLKNNKYHNNKNKLEKLLKYKLVVCDYNFLVKNKDLFYNISFFCTNNNLKLYVIGDLHPNKFIEEMIDFKFYDKSNYVSSYHYYKNFFNQIYKSDNIVNNLKSDVCKNQVITDLLDENKFTKYEYTSILEFVKDNDINFNSSEDSFNLKKNDSYNNSDNYSENLNNENSDDELNPEKLLNNIENWTEIS